MLFCIALTIIYCNITSLVCFSNKSDLINCGNVELYISYIVIGGSNLYNVSGVSGSLDFTIDIIDNNVS